jgi:hypothetical protein
LTPAEAAQISRKTWGHNTLRGTTGTGENEWYTPDEYLDIVREVLGGIDLDPATSDAAQSKIQATNFFTKNDNGLAHEWHGRDLVEGLPIGRASELALARALNAALAYVEKVGGFSLLQVANWRLASVSAMLKICDPRRHHRPLAFVEMPAMQVAGNNEGNKLGIVAFINARLRLYVEFPASAIAIAPVDNAAVAVQPYRLTQAMRANIAH